MTTQRSDAPSLRLALVALVATLLAALGGPARADPVATVETDHITAEIVLRQAAVAPGDTAEIAIQQTIAPGWHTYWTNPGDSGEPKRLSWKLPGGAQPGPIRWPAPKRVPYDPLMNYGYEGSVTTLTSVRVPSDWTPGRPLPVGLGIDWLVCADICIPEGGETAFEIPTAAETRADSTTAFVFLMAERAIPAAADWPATARLTDAALTLEVAGVPADTRVAYFFPDTPGLIDHAAPQALAREGDRLVLSMEPGRTAADPLEGLLELTGPDGERTVRALSAPLDDARTGEETAAAVPGGGAAGVSGGGAGATPSAGPNVGTADVARTGSGTGIGGMGLAQAILFALAGGIILNLMPCVFPVLALKAVGFVRHAGEPAGVRLAHGLAYTGGILACFLALAAALLAVKAAGGAAGWGFQLQDPLVVAILAYVIFAVGLNLSGLFEVGAGLTRAGNLAGEARGVHGSFLTGLLAAVVATPCTAPFMAVAIGFALTQGTAVTLAVFVALGLGLALPFLALSALPGLGRAMPKPGAWMVRLKQALAFPMYLAAAWLVWVLAQQAGADAIGLTLAGFVALAFGAWLLGLVQHGAIRGRRTALAGAGVGAAAAIALLVPVAAGTTAATATAGDAAALAEPAYGADVAYAPDRLAALRAEGTPVFLNVTAAWCITCKVNERVALSGDAFRDALADTGTVYMTGDWTNRDDRITALLESFGRAGVPLYVLYPADGGAPRVLPQILTPDMAVDAIRGA